MYNKIICETRTYTDNINTHEHDYLQLIMPLHGVLDIKTDNKELKLDDTQLFMLPSSCQHSFCAKNRNEFLVLDVPQVMVQKDNSSMCQGGRSYELDDKWKAIRFLLLNESYSDNVDNSRINSLFYYFYPFLVENQLPVSAKYIQQHYNEEVSLDKLSEMEHYSVGYYCSWFKKIMDYTPMEYLKKIRLDKSKQLLLNSSLNILQIAVEVGYTHQSSFNRAFKDDVGVTPLEYRQYESMLKNI